MNNKTGLWLNEKTQKEQEDLISKVVQLTPERIKAYQEKRKDLLRARQDKMEKKKLDAEVQTQKKSDEKEKLTKKVEEFGGLWGSIDKVDEQLSCLPAKQHRAAIVSQIDFRKVVLEQVPPDRIIGQKGRTVDGKRVEFSVGELTTNLKTFIEFQAKTAEVRAKAVLSQVEVRPREERHEKLEEPKKEITSKQTKNNENENDDVEKKKTKKKKYPKIFGKKVMHKWTHQDKDHWHLGVVTAVLDEDEQDSECEFHIQYDSDGPDETYDLKLLKDYKRSWLVIVGDADGSKATATSMSSQVNSSPVTPGNSSDGNTHKAFEIIKSTKIANSEKAETPKLRRSKRKRRHADFKSFWKILLKVKVKKIRTDQSFLEKELTICGKIRKRKMSGSKGL